MYFASVESSKSFLNRSSIECSSSTVMLTRAGPGSSVGRYPRGLPGMWSHHDVYLAIACVIRIVVETADRTAELFFCRVSKGLDLNGCLIHKKLGCKTPIRNKRHHFFEAFARKESTVMDRVRCIQFCLMEQSRRDEPWPMSPWAHHHAVATGALKRLKLAAQFVYFEGGGWLGASLELIVASSWP